VTVSQRSDAIFSEVKTQLYFIQRGDPPCEILKSAYGLVALASSLFCSTAIFGGEGDFDFGSLEFSSMPALEFHTQ